MTLSNIQKDEIRNLLRTTLKNKLAKYKRESSYMPFLSKLIQDDEKVAAYSFIHSISTSLGMSIYEEVSKIIAKSSAQTVERGVNVGGTLSSQQKETIAKIVNELREGKRIVNRKKEVTEVLSASSFNGKAQKDNDIADFYMKKDNQEFFFEIKTVKPNIDVFTKSKIKLLEWVARKQKPVNAILAFPYNPYYPDPYSRFTEQGVVEHGTEFLIAEEYWNFIGGKDTFKELLSLFDDVGKELKDEIQKKIKEVAKEKLHN
ncbi:TPA: TdeIII family type II restriction endonuclease [Candidatus Woesearchaeota archaeon]|nr:TdeIII family type II restriction endonuclease [Candidatus Woesearchaeota archaeon]